MLAAAAARALATRCPPAAVGRASLLRAAALAPPRLGRERRRCVAVAAVGGPPGSLILRYEYTHHDAELLESANNWPMQAKREPYLEEHLHKCREMADAGKLLLWGAVGSPITSGLLIWRSADEGEVRAWMSQDPLVKNGLVRAWTIEPLHVHAAVAGGAP